MARRPRDLAAPGSGPARHRAARAAVTLGLGVIQVDVSILNVAVKPIGAALGGGVGGVQWVVDAYPLVFAAHGETAVRGTALAEGETR